MASPRLLHLRGRARSRAFTLIELLVVVVILAILLAVAIPAYLSQQTKAKDAKAKQYLAYAYRAIRSGIPETNEKFPTNTSMVSWVQQSEPELTSAVGNCYALGSLTANTVVVDQGSSSGNLTLCTRSDSGNVWKLAATPTSAPSFVDATVVPLAVSGNEITDSTRTAGLQGDGRAPPDSSTGIWEGTANLMPNGGFESGVLSGGWNGLGCCLSNAVATWDTTHAKFGSASLKLAYDGGAGTTDVRYQHALIAASASTTYTVSAWVDASGFVAPARNNWGILVMDQTGLGIATTTLSAPTSGWVRQSVTFTTAGAVTGLNVALMSPQGTVWWDGAQIEQKSIATPYVETSGATAIRSAARIQAPAALLNATQGWVAERVRMGWQTSSQPSTFPVFFTWRSADNSDIIQMLYAGGNVQMERRAAGVLIGVPAKATTWALGDIITVVCWWTATQTGVSVNGSVATVAANTGIPTTLPSLFDIGSVGGGNSFTDSDLLWFSTGTGTLTDADTATINGFGNNDPNVSSFPTSAQADFVWNGVGSNGSLK